MAAKSTPLRLVGEDPGQRPLGRFCGHCAAPPGEGIAAAAGSRVCTRCGLGLVLEAPPETAPTRKDAFVVVDSTMVVRAVSRVAERHLGVSEPAAVDRHLSDFLTPADTDGRAAEIFFALVLHAATTRAEPHTVAVRPPGEFGIRYWARVSTCGPSIAALLLLFDMQ